MSKRQTPSEFLKQIVGKPVVVKLNSGTDYRGLFSILLFFNVLKIFSYRNFNLLGWVYEYCIRTN